MILQPKSGFPAGGCMHNSIVITRKPDKSSPLRCNIFTIGNGAEGTLQSTNSFTSGILGGTEAPMPNEIIAFVLPKAGG